MDIFNTLTDAVISLVSALFGYFLGRRAKIDEILLTKRHELAEQLYILLQEDFDDRLSLRKEYRNFIPLTNPTYWVYRLDKNDEKRELYSIISQRVDQISTRRASIKETNQKAAIYLPNNVTAAINEYLELTDFTNKTERVGRMNDVVASFFYNLMDKNTWESFKRLYDLILTQLRKALR
jgi:hypothetical protein